MVVESDLSEAQTVIFAVQQSINYLERHVFCSVKRSFRVALNFANLYPRWFTKIDSFQKVINWSSLYLR